MSGRYSNRLPRTYSEAERMLGNRERRTLINNTVIERGGRKRVNVLYHGNLIAAFDPNGSRMLTNSGYGTVSTRDRLNAMAPAGVGFVQRNHSQQVHVRDATNGEDHNRVIDGGTVWIDRDGHVSA